MFHKSASVPSAGRGEGSCIIIRSDGIVFLHFDESSFLASYSN